MKLPNEITINWFSIVQVAASIVFGLLGLVSWWTIVLIIIFSVEISSQLTLSK